MSLKLPFMLNHIGLRHSWFPKHQCCRSSHSHFGNPSKAAVPRCLSLVDLYHTGHRHPYRASLYSTHPFFISSALVPKWQSKSWRGLHAGLPLREKDSSKVESAVKAMKEAELDKPVIAPKRPLWKRIWDELVHYYHGFRLLFIDINVSARLVWKLLNGQDWSRRENQQLIRTMSDVFRLLPFSVFIIVPFMELLLPVAIKLFPNMLPSTFQSVSDKEDKIKKQFKVKLEMAKFLQDTLDEMTVHRKGEKHSHNAKEFALFFEKVRTSGQQTSNEEILKFSKLFEDEITLDSLSRPQLTALCRLLEMKPIGPNAALKWQLAYKLRKLNADDKAINKEGIDSLTVPELQEACRSRGMRALGIPEHRLRSQLSQWLDLSMNEQIPPSLLLLSRALYLPENLATTDVLKATISSLPETVVTEVKYNIGEQEGKIDNKTKIELIRKEEAAIKQETEEQLLEEKRAREELVDTAPILDANARPAMDETIALKKQELSKEDFDELEDALDQISMEKKRLLVEEEELVELKEEMQDYKEDVEELKEVVLQTGDTKVYETKAASHLYKSVNKMIEKMDKLKEVMNVERSSLQQTMDDKMKEGVNAQTERENIININELMLAIRRIQKSSDDTRLQRIADVLDKLDVDHDGAVEVDVVLKVIEQLGQENVKVSPSQMNEIIDLLAKEEAMDQEERMEKQREKLIKKPEFSDPPIVEQNKQ